MNEWMNEWMCLNGTSLNLRCLRHVCYSHRIVMLHYDPLDQHNLTGVFWVFVALGHHHLLHHLITSRVRNVNSVLLRAYLRSATSFQLYHRVQPSNRPRKISSDRLFASSNKQTVRMEWYRYVIAVRRTAPLRGQTEKQRAAVPEPASRDAVDSSAAEDAGLGWSGLRLTVRFLTGRVTEVRHAFYLIGLCFPFSEDVTKAQTK